MLFDAHLVGKSTHTLRDSKLSLVAREVKRAALWGMSPCAIRCEVTESNRSTKLPVCYVASQTSHRSSPQNGEGEQESMKTCYKEGTVLEAAWQAATA